MSKIETRMDQLEQFVQVVVRQHLDIEHRTNTTIAHLNEVKAALDEIESQFQELEKWHKRLWDGLLTKKQRDKLSVKSPYYYGKEKRYAPAE